MLHHDVLAQSIVAPGAGPPALPIAASFLTEHGFDIALNLATMVLGALLGVALQGFGKSRRATASGITVQQTVQILVVQITQQRQPTRTGSQPGIDPAVRDCLVGVVVVAVAYLSWPQTAVSVLLGLVGFAAGVVVGWARGLHARGAFDGAQWRSVWLRALLPYVVGLAGVALLVTAPFQDDASRLFDAFEDRGLPGLVEEGGLDAVTFVVYQSLGIVGIVLALTLPLLALVALQAAINVNANARGRPLAMAVLRRTARWGTRWRSTLNRSLIVALVACGLCSGAVSDLVGAASEHAIGEGPRVTGARATARGHAVTIGYRLDERATVTVRVLSTASRRQLREVTFDDAPGRHTHRFRAVSAGPTPHRLTVQLIASGSFTQASALNLPVRRK